MFSDVELRQYLDNEADAALSESIEDALAEDTALEDRLMALDDLAPLVRASLELLPEPQIDTSVFQPDEPEPVAEDTGDWNGWLRLAAGFAAGAVLAGGIAWSMRPDAPDWRMAVASYQALYSEETIAAIDITDDELQAQMAEAEERVGTSGLYDLVSEVAGLTVLRVQTLAFQGDPLIQIVFATEDGLPVALCIVETSTPQGGADDAVILREGLASLSFDTYAHRWLLIGTEDEQFISDTGRTLQERLLARS